MKKIGLKIGSLLLAIMMIFVSMGWDVCFHYCTSSHTVTSSIGVGTPTHAHCPDLSSCHEKSHRNHPAAAHFDTKGCCEDFDSRIQFTDNFTFSPEKHLTIFFRSVALPVIDKTTISLEAVQVFRQSFSRKRSDFFSGRDRSVFFSCLRLNPLVF